MSTTVKLRQLTTAAGLTPAELELLAYNNWIIENALNSVGAVSPVPSSSPPPPTIPIRHDQLLELTDDDHLQYLLLAGRGGGGQDITNPVRIGGQTVVVTNDARLSDARTPTAHKTSHQAGGSDIVESFPVGSVFIAVVSTNPATLLGYGTWSAFAAGRVLVGLNSGDTDFDTVEETGGAKTVASAGTVGIIAATDDLSVVMAGVGAAVPAETHTHPAPTYTGSATSVVQPYIVVYMWKRTA